MTQEFGYVVYRNKSVSEKANCQRIALPPIRLRIEKTRIKCGSMMYFPPLDDDGKSHTLSSEGPLTTIQVPWGDVVPGSVIQLSDIYLPVEQIDIRIRWSMFMPGVVLYFSKSQEIPKKIKNHPMVLVIPWKENKF